MQFSIICNRFQIQTKINNGSFGQIYKGIEIASEVPVAIKIEKIEDDNPTLRREAQIISQLQGVQGIPVLYGFEKVKNHYIMVMDLLGNNLSRFLSKHGRPFSLKTTLMIADQLITRLEDIHAKGVLHRDLKPENIVVGRKTRSNKIYLIDFGLSKMYQDSNGTHIPWRDGKGLVGTARFASLHTHFGHEQGRRDDLESLMYTLIYMHTLNLPWLHPPETLSKEEKYLYICNSKNQHTVEQITRGLPSEFCCALNYIKNLGFDEEPNYRFLKGLFRKLFLRNSFEFNYIYDWKISKEKENKNNQEAPNDFEEDMHAKANLRLTKPFKPQFNTLNNLNFYKRAPSSDNFSFDDEEEEDKNNLETGTKIEKVEDLFDRSISHPSILSVRRGVSEFHYQEFQAQELIVSLQSPLAKKQVLSPMTKKKSCSKTLNVINEQRESNKSIEYDPSDDEFFPHEDKLIIKCRMLNAINNHKGFIEDVNTNNMKLLPNPSKIQKKNHGIQIQNKKYDYENKQKVVQISILQL